MAETVITHIKFIKTTFPTEKVILQNTCKSGSNCLVNQLLDICKIYITMTELELSLRIRRAESFIVASDGQFLGQLSSNKFLTESVMNEYGSYGSRYSSTSIFNPYCPYGSIYSVLSPFNQYSNTPPLLYLRGLHVGYLSKNLYIPNRIDPNFLFDYIIKNGL